MSNSVLIVSFDWGKILFFGLWSSGEDEGLTSHKHIWETRERVPQRLVNTTRSKQEVWRRLNLVSIIQSGIAGEHTSCHGVVLPWSGVLYWKKWNVINVIFAHGKDNKKLEWILIWGTRGHDHLFEEFGINALDACQWVANMRCDRTIVSATNFESTAGRPTSVTETRSRRFVLT
jgi:hypothetical protein